ncbi:hypothetical protein [Moorena sp. SIO4E2]|uniref:hypothetical protein n=1 Tax=Moorena sp. SIO4E2 TaxID=2607826 RepID=UPI00257BFF69|nr:hypothetical protein [Moorena sp. SIO4E2]
MPVTVFGRAVPTLGKRWKIRASLLVVRYGADYPNPGYEAKNKGKSAPNTPYALIENHLSSSATD